MVPFYVPCLCLPVFSDVTTSSTPDLMQRLHFSCVSNLDCRDLQSDSENGCMLFHRMCGVIVWVRDGLAPMPSTPSIRFGTLKWMRMHRFSLSIEVRGGFICGYLYLRPLFPECSHDDRGQRPLVSGVARIYTKREDADRRPFLPVPRGGSRGRDPLLVVSNCGIPQNHY